MDSNNLRLAHSLAWEATDIARIAAELDAAEARGRAASKADAVAFVLAHIGEMLAESRQNLSFSSGAAGYYSALCVLRDKITGEKPLKKAA